MPGRALPRRPRTVRRRDHFLGIDEHDAGNCPTTGVSREKGRWRGHALGEDAGPRVALGSAPARWPAALETGGLALRVVAESDGRQHTLLYFWMNAPGRRKGLYRETRGEAQQGPRGTRSSVAFALLAASGTGGAAEVSMAMESC